MSLVQQKASGMGLGSAGGDPPKKPPGRSRLPLPVDRPDVKILRRKKGQASQVISSYEDLPDKSACYDTAIFSKDPPPHLSEGDKEEYGKQHGLLSGAPARLAAGTLQKPSARDVGSRARRVMWHLWFRALEEARRLGEAGEEDSSDDAEGETDEEAMDETEDEDAEGDTDPDIKEEEVE